MPGDVADYRLRAGAGLHLGRDASPPRRGHPPARLAVSDRQSCVALDAADLGGCSELTHEYWRVTRHRKGIPTPTFSNRARGGAP